MITFENIHKSFGSNHVLRGVNLTVERGESMVIIGGSGTGKSVLIKTVLGLVKPDSGRIKVDGQDVTQVKRDAFLSRFGMLFHGGALFDSLPVWQNVAFRLMRGALKRPKAEAREIAIEKGEPLPEEPAAKPVVEAKEGSEGENAPENEGGSGGDDRPHRKMFDDLDI